MTRQTPAVLWSAGLAAVCDVNSVLERLHGADPIIGAVRMKGAAQGVPLDGVYIRKKPKKHGTQRLMWPAPPSPNPAVHRCRAPAAISSCIGAPREHRRQVSGFGRATKRRFEPGAGR